MQRLSWLPNYCVVLLALLGMSSFAEAALVINSATLNGGSSVIVEPGATISASVNATSNGGTQWGSTRWDTTGGTGACVNTGNHTNETASETFSITAPSTPGVYSVTFFASSSNNQCNGTLSPTFTLTNSIIVNSRRVNSVSLNSGTSWQFDASGNLTVGGASVTVDPGESIAVSVNVTTIGSGSNDDWDSTTWEMGSSISDPLDNCVNTGDHASAGTFTENFTITALSTPGTYSVAFRAHDGDTCSTTNPGLIATLASSVTVRPTGACCLPNGTCRTLSSFTCSAQSGCYQGDNIGCGAGTATTYTRTHSPGLAITDNNATGVNSTLVIGDSYPIGDIDVELNIIHTFQGDIMVRLIAPGGSATVTLVNRPGQPQTTNGFSANNFGNAAGTVPFVLDDSASSTYDTPPVADPGTANVTGSWKPDLTSLATLNGTNVNGTWTLTVSDHASSDTGTLTRWSLVAKPLACPIINTNPTNATACEDGSASFTVVASGTGLSYQWRRNTVPLSNGGGISGATSATLTINPVAAANAGSYDVVVTSGSCTKTSTAATLTVVAKPTASAGGPYSTCATSAVSLSGSATNQSSVSWSTPDGTGTFTNGNTLTATYNPTAADVTAGTRTMRLTVNGNSPCAAAISDATLTLTANPTTATVGGNQTICALGTTSGLGGNPPSVGTGAWSIDSGGTGSFNPSAATPNATFTHATGAGPVVLRWTISNPPCAASSATVTITINQAPTTATVGGPQTICALGTATGLGGNTPSVGTGAWSVVSGGTGTFNPNNTTPNATFTHTGGAGPVVLRWTISNAPCTASTADVTITINQNPSTATVGGPQTICALGTTAGLGGNTPSVGTGAWSIDSGGTGTFNPNNTMPNATFTHGTGTGPIVVRWTISNAPCTASSATVTITINQNPSTATVGGPQTICTLGTTADLGGNTPTVGTGAWSVESGGTGTFNPNNTTPNATFTHATGAGPIVVRWTISNAPCTTSFAEVTITIREQPSASVGGPQTICSLGTTTGLGGNTPTPPATGAWTVESGGTGTFNPNASDPNATFTHATGAGPIVLRWTISNPPCAASFAEVTITIGAQPAAPDSASADPVSFCTNDAPKDITLTATGGSGATLHWFDDACGGNEIGTGSPLVIAAPTATTTYYVRWENDCGESTCAEVTVTVNTSAAASASNDGPVCSGSDVHLGALPDDMETYAWTGPSSFTSADQNPTVSPAVAGEYCVTVTDKNGCSNTACTTVVVNAQPVAPDSASADPSSFCTNDAPKDITLTATGGSGTTLRWFDDKCGGNEIGTGSPLVIDAPTATTTYYVRWENDCGESTCAEITVTVNTSPTTATVGGPQSICSGGTTAGLGGNAPLVGSGAWSIVGAGSGTFNPSDTTPNATFTHTGGAGPITLRWTISNPPCTDSAAEVIITIIPSTNIDVTVELGGGVVEAGPFTRCITFEFWNTSLNNVAPIYVTNELMTFTSGSSGTVTLAAPCQAAGYTCVTARDRLHTLRRTIVLSSPPYVASFTAGNGKALIGGNLNDSRFVDIIDFGIFTTQDMSNVGASTTCSMMPPATRHADVNGDGAVESIDFAFISNNFLAVRDGNCGSNPNSLIADEQPISRISVAELRQQGLSDLARSDLNHDGWLDQQDVMLWMQGVRPSNPPTPAGPRPGRPIQVAPGQVSPIEGGFVPSNGVQGK